jgi:hypothetical protein
MTTRIRRVPIAMCIMVLCVLWAARLPAQIADPCKNDQARQSWDNRRSPAYDDAMSLAHTLSNHGILVECIRGSKMEQFFEGQKGAAWFKTNQGIFEVLFLPSPETFAGLEIIDRGRNGRHIYSFRGTPRISRVMDSSEPNYFIKHENALFSVWGDEELAHSIEKAVEQP